MGDLRKMGMVDLGSWKNGSIELKIKYSVCLGVSDSRTGAFVILIPQSGGIIAIFVPQSGALFQKSTPKYGIISKIHPMVCYSVMAQDPERSLVILEARVRFPEWIIPKTLFSLLGVHCKNVELGLVVSILRSDEV